MSRKTTYARLLARATEALPDLADVRAAIEEGRILVDGMPVRNPDSFVPKTAVIRLARSTTLRGETKLGAALDAFGVDVRGRVAADIGAAAGGFTRALLARGARRVYAVDAGFGQLRGSLRLDPRVVNLERTNLARLQRSLIPDEIDVIAVDLSYLSLSRAIPQLDGLGFPRTAELVALVKPMFELRLPSIPADAATLAQATARAAQGLEDSGWHVDQMMRSPILGSRGAVEFLLHARRSG